jgi:hypothetical protein
MRRALIAVAVVSACHHDPAPVLVPTTGDVGVLAPPPAANPTPVAPADPPPTT